MAETAVSEFRGVARGGIGNLFGALCAAIANFGLTVVIARSVSSDRAGQFFAVTSVFLLAEAMGRLGSDTGLVYFIARWRALGEPQRIPMAIRAAVRPCFILGTLMGSGVFIFAPAIARLLGDEHAREAGLLRLLAVVLPITISYDLFLAATRGFRTMRPTVLIEKVARPGVQLILVLAAVALSWNGGIGIGWTIPYVGAALAAVYLLHKAVTRAGLERLTAKPDPALLREFWRFSLPRAAAAIAQLASQRLDIVLVAAMRGPADAAIYTAATRFLVVGQFANQAINTAVQPRLSEAVSTGATGRAQALYQVSTAWIVLVNWPLFGAAATLAPIYLKVFGGGYRAGATVVVLLSVAMLVASGVGVVDSVIIMAGRTTWNLMTTVLALGLNIIVDLILIPPFGILGAAIGWAVGILGSNLVPLALVWRRLGLHPFGRGTHVAYALCAACYLVLPVLAWILSGGREIVVGIALIAGTAVFVAGLVRWRSTLQLNGLLPNRRQPTHAR